MPEGVKAAHAVGFSSYKKSGKIKPLSDIFVDGGSGGKIMAAVMSGDDGSVTQKDYIDSRLSENRAHTDAKFAEIQSSIFRVESIVRESEIKFDSSYREIRTILDTKPGIYWLLGACFSVFLGIVSLLAFGADRFDGGMSAGGLNAELADKLNKDLAERQEAYYNKQALRDDAQDARLDRILAILEEMKVNPTRLPEAPKAP